MGNIERAIRDSDLGVNPANDGKVLRCVFPELTEERRKEYIKVAQAKAEDGRVAVRNLRRTAKQGLEKLEKDGEVGKDDVTGAEKRLDGDHQEAHRRRSTRCSRTRKPSCSRSERPADDRHHDPPAGAARAAAARRTTAAPAATCRPRSPRPSCCSRAIAAVAGLLEDRVHGDRGGRRRGRDLGAAPGASWPRASTCPSSR